jgi:hypothetical protein
MKTHVDQWPLRPIFSKKMYFDEKKKKKKKNLFVCTTEERSYWVLSLQMQAKSEDVSTHFVTDGVLAHAFITFSLTFISISAMHFCI